MDLTTNTLFTGKVCIYLAQVGSTQQYLQELIAKSKPIEGTAILSYDQRSGLGQRGNKWQMNAGESIAVSLVFYPGFLLPQQQFFFNMAMALAVRDCVAAVLEVPVYIKWPNDIIAAGKKLAGLLINGSISGRSTDYLITGVGLNVNQQEFPEEIPHAGSLRLASGSVYNLNEITSALFKSIEARYLQLKSGKNQEITTTYNAGLFKRGSLIHYHIDSGIASTGVMSGVDHNGNIEIMDATGKISAFRHGEIHITDWYC